MFEVSIYKPETESGQNAKPVHDTLPNHEGHSMQEHLEVAKTQYDLALGCVKQSVQHVWLMGKALIEAKEKHRLRKQKLGKEQPNWDVVLKQIGISVASDNRARRLVAAFPNVDQVLGYSIMEAYQEAGITKLPLPEPPEPTAPLKSQSHSFDEVPAETVAISNSDYSFEVSEADKSTSDAAIVSQDQSEFPEDSTESEDPVSDRSYVDTVLDISANLDALRRRNESLSAEDLEAVLDSVELIAQYALEIKMRLGAENADVVDADDGDE